MVVRIDIARPKWCVLLAGFGVVAGSLVGCQSAASECTVNSDCHEGMRCVNAGGIFFRGGRCVPRGSAADTGPSPTDTDEDRTRFVDGADATPTRFDTVAVDSDETVGDANAADSGDTYCSKADCPDEYCYADNASGPCVHTIAVTSETWTGNLSGTAGADFKCQKKAEKRGFGDNWRAVVLDGNSTGPGHIEIDGPVTNIKGQLVAPTAKDFWSGRAVHPVRYGFAGEKISGRAWTGPVNDGNGSLKGTCRAWISKRKRVTGITGITDAKRDWLTGGSTQPCSRRAHLFCVSVP